MDFDDYIEKLIEIVHDLKMNLMFWMLTGTLNERRKNDK
jgi:hypothetical protein